MIKFIFGRKMITKTITRLSIDPGTKEMGFAVFDDDWLADFGLLKLDNTIPVKDFIIHIENELAKGSFFSGKLGS